MALVQSDSCLLSRRKVTITRDECFADWVSSPGPRLFPAGFLLIRQGLQESRKVLKSADLNVDLG